MRAVEQLVRDVPVALEALPRRLWGGGVFAEVVREHPVGDELFPAGPAPVDVRPDGVPGGRRDEAIQVRVADDLRLVARLPALACRAIEVTAAPPLFPLAR